jgi:hypothetical protein
MALQLATGLTEMAMGQPAHYLAVANPTAGDGAPNLDLAYGLQEELGSDYFSVVETDADPEQRTKWIVDGLRRCGAAPTRPVELVSIGGDGTLNDTVTGALNHIFGADIDELWNGAPEAAAERMARSGLRIATLGTGGACDNALLSGAPVVATGRRMSTLQARGYLVQTHYAPLNMGAAFLAGLPAPQLITHSFSMGRVLAPAFQDTATMRGATARTARQWACYINVAKVLSGQSPALITRFCDASGKMRTLPVAEVAASAVVRTDGKYGATGTPSEGLGVKIIPDSGAVRLLLSLLEIPVRGLPFLAPYLLGPDSRMLLIPEDMQIVLGPAMEIDFEFLEAAGDGDPFARQLLQNTPAMANGDFAGASYAVRLRGLPSFPRFRVLPGSILARIRTRATATALAAPPQRPALPG